MKNKTLYEKRQVKDRECKFYYYPEEDVREFISDLDKIGIKEIKHLTNLRNNSENLNFESSLTSELIGMSRIRNLFIKIRL